MQNLRVGYSQRNGTTGTPEQSAADSEQVRQTYDDMYNAAVNGNRAPLILGNHFNEWNNGAYPTPPPTLSCRPAESPTPSACRSRTSSPGCWSRTPSGSPNCSAEPRARRRHRVVARTGWAAAAGPGEL